MSDSGLSMVDTVASVCHSAYYHLQQVRPILQSLSRDAAKTLVETFVTSRLDYCNSVLHDVTDNLLHRLQSLQNAAARLITQTGRHEHISPVLQEFHCMAACLTPSGLQTGNPHCSSHCTAVRCRISQTRASRHLKPVAISARLAPSHASYRGPELVWVTVRLTSPDSGFGTSCPLHCSHLTVSLS